MKRFSWKLLILLFPLMACNRSCATRTDMTAEEVVEAYLNVVFNMEKIEQKQKLLEYSTGELRDAISNASDETIIAAYIDRRYALKSFSIVSRRDLSPRETEVRFQLTYKETPEGEKDPENAIMVNTENTVHVFKENNQWAIGNVLGSNTSFDFPTTTIKP